jgi:hypothetical protein
MLMDSGYPRAFFFRFSEGVAARPNIPYERWEKSFERLMGIEGKVLEEEIPGRSKRNIEFFTQFKKRHPRQLVMLHYNGNARDPRDQKGKFFAGHWLYYNGAKIVADLPAAGGESVIRVSDASLFVTNTGRYKNANEDVGICQLDAAGKPDWRNSEQAKLISVDRAKNEIRVSRGQYGTAPRAFSAGNSYAAAHVSEGPWGKDSNLLWDYNHSTACPRDANGKTCTDVLVEDLGAHFDRGGDLEAFDGLEFDVLKYSLGARRGKRGIDTNGDGEADNGVVGRRDMYAAGTTEFCRRLHERLGEIRLILADGWSLGNQRAFGILNGIESEGWPALKDYQVLDWTGGLNRQLFWVANSRPPAFNYINHKFNIDGEIVDSSSPDVPFNIHRLVFAGAVFTDSAICYSLRPPTPEGELMGVWDELWAGAEHRLGWLGKPLGPAVHLALSRPDLLAGRGLEHIKRDASGSETVFRVTGLPAGASFLTFTARAAGTGRLIRIGDSYAWINQKEFRYVHSFSGDSVEFSVEGAEPVWITSLSVHASPDAMYREFENGVVIANPGTKPYMFDLAKLFPGKGLQRLKGSPDQDPKVNSGAPVSGPVTLGPKDALFLKTMRSQ